MEEQEKKKNGKGGRRKTRWRRNRGMIRGRRKV
jgi:hypothetical protein